MRPKLEASSEGLLERRTTIAIVAYHFYPSPEVGAKRMAALASRLRELGEPVAIFSAFFGLDRFAVDDVRWKPLREYELHRVQDPPSSMIAFLVGTKRLLRQILAGVRRRQPVAVKSTVKSPPEGQGSERSVLHRLVFNVLHVVDDKKGWTIRLWRTVQAALKNQPGAVIIVSGPPMSSLLGASLAARAMRVPIIVDIRDPIVGEYEQSISGHGVPNQWGRRILEWYVLHHATFVVATSPSLLALLQRRYPDVRDRMSCIYNGFDEPPLPKRAHTGNRLVIVYAGALYLNRNPFPFLQALNHLLERDDVDASRIEVVFAGDCEHYRGISLSEWIASRRCARVVKLSPQIESDKVRLLYERATLLLNFAEGQRMQVPAKTFELLALGRELLMLCEPTSDTAALVQGIEGVSCATSTDEDRLRALLIDIYRRHVDQGSLRCPAPVEIDKFSRASQNQRFVELIAIAKRSRPCVDERS